MVDAVTRNITVQANGAEPDHVLRPGMFGKVEVELPEKHKTLVVPARRFHTRRLATQFL